MDDYCCGYRPTYQPPLLIKAALQALPSHSKKEQSTGLISNKQNCTVRRQQTTDSKELLLPSPPRCPYIKGSETLNYQLFPTMTIISGLPMSSTSRGRIPVSTTIWMRSLEPSVR